MGLLSSVMGRASKAFSGLGGGGQGGGASKMLSDLDSKYGTSVLGFINNPAVVTPTGMVDSSNLLKQVNQAAGVQDASNMLSGSLPPLFTPQMPSLTDVDPRKAMGGGALQENPQAYGYLGSEMLKDYNALNEPFTPKMIDFGALTESPIKSTADYERDMNAIRSGMLDSRVIR